MRTGRVRAERSSLLSYTLRYVSLTELGTPCQFGLRVVVYYNGESESYREEMIWCRCYEGQRDEV